MSTFRPEYRLTLRKPRSVDATEAAVLVPAAGAPHALAAQFTTVEEERLSAVGMGSWLPLMKAPTGRRQSLDPLTKRLSIGEHEIELLDRRITAGGSNALRQFTAFLGDVKGVNQCLGLKADEEESLDGGATWSPSFTGRVKRTRTGKKLWGGLTIWDATSELKTPVFVGRPHSSIAYVVSPQLLPIGLSAAFGAMTAAPTFRGTLGATYGGKWKRLTLDAASTASKYNRISNIFRRENVPYNHPAQPKADLTGAIVVILSDGTDTGEFLLGDIEIVGNADYNYYIYQLVVAEKASTDAGYLPFSSLSGTLTVSVRLVANEPSAASPLLISDVHPVQLWRDMLDGKFGYLNADGTVQRTYPYDATAFTALIADSSLALGRWVITKRWDLNAFIEEQICQPWNLTYRTDEQGRVVPLDLRLPSSLSGIPTLTDPDLVRDEDIEWEQTRDGAINRFRIKYYDDLVVTPEEVESSREVFLDIPTALIRPVERQLLLVDFGRTDMGDKEFTIDAQGFRSQVGEKAANGDRTDYVAGLALALAEQYRMPFATGPAYARAKFRRGSANVAGLAIGSWVLIQCGELPDPQTYVRGGMRLMRVVEWDPQQHELALRLLDAGPNAFAASPTLGALAAGGDTLHEVDAAISALNAAGDPVTLWYNITATSVGARPAETDAHWIMVRRATAAGTYRIANLPPNSRIWVRGRSELQVGTDRKLPSAFVFPSGTGYLDTAALSNPNTLTVTPAPILAGSTVVAAWVNSVTTVPIVFVLNDGTSDVLTLVLAAGSTSMTLNPYLLSSTTYTFKVGYQDIAGGTVTYATSAGFTTPAGFTGPAWAVPSIAFES